MRANLRDVPTLVLGSNGQLGHILSEFAQAEKQGWQGQARQQPADLIWSGAFDDPSLATALSGGFHTVINLIGVTRADAIAQMEGMNVRFVVDLFSCAAQSGVAHIVLASSAAVYGAAAPTPLSETTPLAPVTAYGRTKARMEDAALNWSARNGGPAVTIVRIGNVAGADALLRSASRHAGHIPMPLHVLPDGSAPLRPYIGPHDFFRAMRAIANRKTVAGRADIFNLAHPVPLALDALLMAYRDLILPELIWAAQPLPDGTPPKVIFDTAKLAELIDLPCAADQARETARQVTQLRSLSKDTL